MKMLSLFSGIGAFEKALKNLGVELEMVGYSEIDRYASASYLAIHGDAHNFGDITQMDTKDLPDDIDLITYGFPCVPKGYLVNTKDGYKKIEDITTEDIVITHTGEYKKVVKIMNRTSDHIYTIKGVGCYDLKLTEEHPLYVLRDGNLQWVKVKDLQMSDFITYNINKCEKKSSLPANVLWLLGRYFADGYKENHGLRRPIICVGKDKIEEFENKIGDIDYLTNHESRSCVEYKIIDPRYAKLFEGLLTGSKNKEIPRWIIDMPKDELQYFFDGYFSGDGHDRKDRNMKTYTTVSEKMALALQEIVIKLYRVVPSINVRKDERKATFNNNFCSQFTTNPRGQIILTNHVAVPIKHISREDRPIEVYNFEVQDDNSYTVNNVIVHNCQDISVAGRTQGMFNDDGSLTRSGLFFEALRVIEDTQPKVAIAENVKNLVGKKFKPQFELVLQSLENAGYNNYWKVLNAKDFGIPQNRERVFIVSIRKDIDDGTFTFPEGWELEKRLIDVLDEEVEEKYYVNNERAENLINQLIADGKIPENGGEYED